MNPNCNMGKSEQSFANSKIIFIYHFVHNSIAINTNLVPVKNVVPVIRNTH